MIFCLKNLFPHKQRTTDNGQRSTNRGLTLIEATLAIAIIGAGMIGMMYSFTGGSRSSVMADQTIIAANLAKEKIDEIVADRTINGYPATITTSYTDGPIYSIFSRTVTITEVDPDDDDDVDDFLDASPGSGYARVTVAVTWTGSTEKVQMSTLIAEYTP
ncbi:MAG: type II secretion system protein [bacterium]|nr:type II secretion system GspH family protein [bacterium]MBU1918607.1 type II secretion system GspH family protein [bacterium]